MLDKISEAIKVILWLALIAFLFGYLMNSQAHAATHYRFRPCDPHCAPFPVPHRKPPVNLDTVYAIGYGGTTGRYTLAPVGSS